MPAHAVHDITKETCTSQSGIQGGIDSAYKPFLHLKKMAAAAGASSATLPLLTPPGSPAPSTAGSQPRLRQTDNKASKPPANAPPLSELLLVRSRGHHGAGGSSVASSSAAVSTARRTHSTAGSIASSHIDEEDQDLLPLEDDLIWAADRLRIERMLYLLLSPYQSLSSGVMAGSRRRGFATRVRGGGGRHRQHTNARPAWTQVALLGGQVVLAAAALKCTLFWRQSDSY